MREQPRHCPAAAERHCNTQAPRPGLELQLAGDMAARRAVVPTPMAFCDKLLDIVRTWGGFKMVRLRSPVSSGFFSFKMPNTRSA